MQTIPDEVMEDMKLRSMEIAAKMCRASEGEEWVIILHSMGRMLAYIHHETGWDYQFLANQVFEAGLCEIPDKNLCSKMPSISEH